MTDREVEIINDNSHMIRLESYKNAYQDGYFKGFWTCILLLTFIYSLTRIVIICWS